MLEIESSKHSMEHSTNQSAVFFFLLTIKIGLWSLFYCQEEGGRSSRGCRCSVVNKRTLTTLRFREFFVFPGFLHALDPKTELEIMIQGAWKQNESIH